MHGQRILSPRALIVVAGAVSATALASVPASAPSAALVSAAAKAQPSASCTESLTRLDVRLGDGIPLPPEFSNPTSSTVRFTIRLAQSWFFGPARDIGTVTLPPHLGRLSPRALPTFLYTPLGVGRLTIEVRTDHTGDVIVGRCGYQLHLHAPPPVRVLTGLRLQERWLLQVPVQMCAIEGSDLAGAAKPGQTVPPGDLLKTLGKVNAEIWYPQAQIAFSTATDYAIPVIADPTPPAISGGQLGDLDAAFVPEVEDARDLCLQAWHDRFPGRVGIPVINARSFIESGNTLGVAPHPDPGLYVAGGKFGSGKRGDDLCGSPVRLTPADISGSDANGPVVAMIDQRQLWTNATSELAHELGHNLFLGHGNGLDDNGDGRPAGIPGPKRYDEYCDPGWLLPPHNTDVAEDQATPFVDCATSSLMNQTASCTNLQPLQVETARGVAPVIPGTVNGAERPVLDILDQALQPAS